MPEESQPESVLPRDWLDQPLIRLLIERCEFTLTEAIALDLCAHDGGFDTSNRDMCEALVGCFLRDYREAES